MPLPTNINATDKTNANKIVIIVIIKQH